MTDRIHALTVVLDLNYRDDSEALERIKGAIRQLKGVADVTEHTVDMADHVAMARVRSETELEIYRAIEKIFRRAP